MKRAALLLDELGEIISEQRAELGAHKDQVKALEKEVAELQELLKGRFRVGRERLADTRAIRFYADYVVHPH